MISNRAHKIRKPKENNRVQRPKQTGFSSPATHYNEPRIDLNKELVPNTESTFFIRITDDSFKNQGVCRNDVLIVDRSLTPKNNQLAVIIREGLLQVVRFNYATTVECDLWGVITYVIKATP
ncbi:MAG: S24 family peptidase [Nonlabens sp.]